MIRTIAMVSSTFESSPPSRRQGFVPGLAVCGCNTNAGGRRVIGSVGRLILIAAVVLLPRPAVAQEDAGWFLLGAGIQFGLHEAGHVAADLAFGVPPGIQKVTFGPFPFFAVTHD